MMNDSMTRLAKTLAIALLMSYASQGWAESSRSYLDAQPMKRIQTAGVEIGVSSYWPGGGRDGGFSDGPWRVAHGLGR